LVKFYQPFFSKNAGSFKIDV